MRSTRAALVRTQAVSPALISNIMQTPSLRAVTSRCNRCYGPVTRCYRMVPAVRKPTANTQPELLALAVVRDYVEGMAPTPGTRPQAGNRAGAFTVCASPA